MSTADALDEPAGRSLRGAGTARDGRLDRVYATWRVGLAIAVGALTLAALFLNGGFFAGTAGLLAVLTGAMAVVWLVAAPDPLAGLTRSGLAGTVALLLLAILDLLSATWSDSGARASLEFDRTVTYAFLFGLFACVPRGRRSIRWLVLAVVPALAAAAVAGWISRAAPQVLDVAAARERPRLSWPVGYWNGLGLACALGLLLVTAIVVDVRRHAVVRAVAGALVPSLMVTGYLTLSRGAIAVAVIGLLPLLLVRGRLALVPVLGAVGAGAVAVAVAYRADALTNGPLRVATLQEAGHDLVLAAITTSVAAGLAVGALAALTERQPRGRPWSWRLRASVMAVLLVTVLVGAAVASGGDRLSDLYEQATDPEVGIDPADARGRLSDVSANGRLAHWDVALDAFRARPGLGTGAGTYEIEWNRIRDSDFVVQDAHSLYLEKLGELGIVGLVLVLVPLVLGAIALARRVRSPWMAAVAGAVVAWLVHAGLDWDWEQPAVSMWLFAVLGAATASDAQDARTAWGSPVRLVGAIGAAFLLITPFGVARSQPHLTRATEAFQRGDCRTAIDEALAAAEAANQRPEPFRLLAFCDVRAGQDVLARQAINGALRRDPADWSLRYAKGLVYGATGRDPGPSMARALRAAPKEELVRKAAKRLRRARTVRARERVSRRLPLLVGPAKP